MRTTIVAALLALSGCVFYFPEEEDDAPPPPPWPDAGWWQVDAAAVDAGGACDMPLACPSASPNRVTVCGRIADVATEASIVSPSVNLTAYDALEYAGNPESSTPLEYEALFYDECGRFRIVNVARPQLGFIALATDDPPNADIDVYAEAAIAFPVSSGETRARERVYAISHTTDAQWSSQAGLSPSFVNRGALLTIFLDESGQPVPGVRVTESGSTEPDNDYYFANANPWARTTIDPMMVATGANGSALKLNSSLVEHSGDANCVGAWDSRLAASIPGVLFVSVLHCYLGP